VVVVVPADVVLAIIDFIGFVFVEEGDLSLLDDDETILDGCFKRETFVFVVVVRFGSCEIDLLLFFVGLRFVVEGIFVTLEEVGRIVLLLLLRRTVEADDVVLVDDELLIKR
jgi:hypothetical protein